MLLEFKRLSFVPALLLLSVSHGLDVSGVMNTFPSVATLPNLTAKDKSNAEKPTITATLSPTIAADVATSSLPIEKTNSKESTSPAANHTRHTEFTYIEFKPFKGSRRRKVGKRTKAVDDIREAAGPYSLETEARSVRAVRRKLAELVHLERQLLTTHKQKMQHLIRTYQRERKFIFEARSKLLEKLKSALQSDLGNGTAGHSTTKGSTKATPTSTIFEAQPTTVVIVKKLEKLEDDPSLQIEDQLAHILPGLEKSLSQPNEVEKEVAFREPSGGFLTPGDIGSLSGLPDATERSL